MRLALLVALAVVAAPASLLAQGDTPIADPTTVPSAEAEAEAEAAEDMEAVETGQQGEGAEPEISEPPEVSDQPEGWGWGAVPAVNYNSDDGFGYGAIVNLYWYEKDIAPYKYSLMGQIYMTTKWVQIHRLKLDALDVFDLPLRIWGELQYYATISQNYCGVGNQVTCDLAIAEAEADRRGLHDMEREVFVNHYYKMRYMQPTGFVNGRWRLTDLPNKLEVMAGWRGSYYYYGDFNEQGPYTYSLYDQDYPEAEDGFASVFQVGLMLDNRDNEPAPTKGYWIEGSVRGSSFAWGSNWDYVGANLTLRGYVPLNRDRSAVLAARLVFDGTWGDMPILEVVRTGGSVEHTTMGGEYQGRGIRSQRYVGRIKAFQQTEARWTFFYFGLLGQKFDLGTLAFMDFGYIGWDWDDFAGEPMQLLWGAGGGIRLAWNKNFIIRFDLAGSPFEKGGPGIYLNLGHIF